MSSITAWLAGGVLLLVAAAVGAFGDGPEPLPPEEAFVPQITGVSADRLDLEFTITDGYYLYRDKLAFRLDATPLTPLALPDGTLTEDAYFGESVIYRDTLAVRLPFDVPGKAGETVLEVEFQGCADIGLCYPPTTVELAVNLPDDVDARAQAAQRELSSLLGNRTVDADTLLPPREAYVPQIGTTEPDRIEFLWQIEPGYYLYRDKLEFRLSGAGEATISNVALPSGKLEKDEFFGDVEIYRGTVRIGLTVNPPLAGNAELVVTYQGCADIGVCFPADTLQLPLAMSRLAVADASSSSGSASDSGSSGSSGSDSSGSDSSGGSGGANNNGTLALSEQDRLSQQLASAGLWLNALSFFALGLLLTFTPCVLPMVPILSSLIVGQREQLTTNRAFLLSLTYVMAMALTYTLVGVIVGLSGYNIQAWFQNPWILSSFAALFVLLSLSMFGLYELQVPVALQQRLMRWSNSQQGGHYGGVAIMGLLSALIVGPCVTAPLVGALIYIAETGDALIGGVALFSLSLGMGLPLLVVGTSAGRWLPKAGVWMQKTKAVFGILLLAMAIWMLSRFLPAMTSMLLAAILAVLSGIWLGATDRIDRQSSALERVGKGGGILVLLYGVALLAGALAGNSSFVAPLRGFSSAGESAATPTETMAFRPVETVEELQRVVADASSGKQTVMLDFYADWCISCKEMESFTFPDPAVRQALSNTLLLKADVTANDADDQALLRHFGLFGPPAIVLYDNTGSEIRAARVVGFMDAESFATHLRRAFDSTSRERVAQQQTPDGF